MPGRIKSEPPPPEDRHSDDGAYADREPDIVSDVAHGATAEEISFDARAKRWRVYGWRLFRISNLR